MNNGLIENVPLPRMSPIPTGLPPQGSLSGPVKAVLFDIYGTLFISGSGDISIAAKQHRNESRLGSLLQSFSIRQTVDELQQKFYAEIETVHARLRAGGVDCPEVDIVSIWQSVLGWTDLESVRRFSTAYEMVVNPVYPMPHMAEVLAWCRGKNHLLGIVSNAQFFTPELFSIFLNADPVAIGFDPELTFYSYRFGIAKPSPQLFERAAAMLGRRHVPKESVLYVGNDMLNDMLPARRTGFQTALFAGDKRSLRLRKNHPECRDLKPDLVITDLIQLIDHLQSAP